jgi:hypothetical protein
MKRMLCLPSIAALLCILPPGVRAADTEDAAIYFSRHVIPVFSRLGCNAGGACHGTNKGQNGFRLSLFGAQPGLDHIRLTRELFTRRLNIADPDQSLILLKATGQVAHGGGKRTDVGSSDYRVLRNWIAAGCKLDDLAKSSVARLQVSPPEQVLKVGESGQLKVTATFTDGLVADVTELCRYESHVEEFATIDAAGKVHARSVGDTVAIIRYGAEPILASVLIVPADGKKALAAVKAHNFIDEHILAKLQALNLPAAPLGDDEVFLRRLYLDVTGFLPPPEEIRSFLADKSPERRSKKIDEVLAKPGYAEVWAAKFSDLIKPVERGNEGSNNLAGGQALRIRFYEWLRARLQENVPYDRLVERIVVSSTLEGRTVDAWAADVEALQTELATRSKGAVGTPLLSAYNQRQTLDLYWQRDGATGVAGAMQFAHTFLGLRLQCAQCHRHPYDVWQQDDLLSFAHFFTAVNTAGGKRNSPEVEAYLNRLRVEGKPWPEELKKLSTSKDPADKAKVAKLQAKIASLNALASAVEVIPLTTGIVASVSVSSPLGTQQSSKARLLGDKAVTVLPADQDRRRLLMDWLRRPDNPYFARAIVNRVWAHYFGRGLIDPPDNLSPLNPPSHAKLLDELCQGFIKSGYDLRWLHRTILQSRTYQQSSLGKANEQELRYYARFPMRRLQGEIILDVLNQATGAKEKYPAGWMFREGERAVLTAGVMVDVYNFYNINDPLRYLVFGRQLRRTNVQCDCEQGRDVALPQMLYLANHEEVQKKISADNGRAALLAGNAKLDNRQRIEELFLSALGRMPGPAEMNAATDHLKTSETLRKGLEEVLWSLVNTREFQLNY